MSEASRDERLDLLALCVEDKRLGRAEKEEKRVLLSVDEPTLFIAAVSKYNVVLDIEARRIQHGCRDFLGQAREGRLCKHVAALLLAIERDTAIEVLRGLTAPRSDWHLEVIGARGFGRR